MTIFSIIHREIRAHLAAYRVQRLLDKRKVAAQRALAADVAKRRASFEVEDYRRRRAAALRGRGIQRLRQA